MYIISKLIRAVIIGSLLQGFAGVTVTVAAADRTGKQGVVIQVSENNPAIWNLALNNAKNIQQELGKDNVTIEIVAYGPGIEMLAFDSEVAPRLKQASADNIALLACGNTMRNRKLTEKDLDSHIRVVATGVVEIMNRQRDGWSYIKP